MNDHASHRCTPNIHTRLTIIRLLCLLSVTMPLSGRELILGDAQDLVEIGLCSPSAPSGTRYQEQGLIQSHTFKLNIRQQDCTVTPTTDGQDCVSIAGYDLHATPGCPLVPARSLTTQLPRQAVVLDVQVISGRYADIKMPLQLAQSAPPQIWMHPENMPAGLPERLTERAAFEKYKNQTDLFPGTLIDYHVGRDNHACYVHMQAYPMQVNVHSQNAALITEATVRVRYTLPNATFSKSQKTTPVDTNECVIICPAQFQEQAQRLAELHRTHENVTTRILTTEAIETGFAPAPEPHYLGFRNEHVAKKRLNTYDYDLARRIISYLRAQDQHPNLRYVVLLGDGAHVPPSYYINDALQYGHDEYENYFDWIPTDFLYTSPDYDYRPNYRLGRLPVSDKAQAEAFVSKIENWLNQSEWDWFQRATVVGGQPFGTPYYIGELSHVDNINIDAFNGMQLTKHFETMGNYKPALVKPHLTNGHSGLFYHVDHGSGSEMGIGHDGIKAEDLMQNTTSASRGRRGSTVPSTPQLPVVLSVACINGAYDTDITKFEDQPEFPELNGHPTSFGEAVVLSPTGGIAYIGGARLNRAGWTTIYDRGRLVSRHEYIVQYLNTIVDCYHQGTQRLGDLVFEGLTLYAKDNPMDAGNREMLFTYLLFGDPVLTLPAAPQGPSYDKPTFSPQGPLRYTAEGLARYEALPPDAASIAVTVTSNAPSVKAKTLYTWTDRQVAQDTFGADPNIATDQDAEHRFPVSGSGLYLLRAEVSDGKETWFYINAQETFTPTANLLIVDADHGRDTEEVYTDLLKQKQIDYDLWESGARDTLTSDILSHYQDGAVLWLSNLTDEEIPACQAYLDRGGALFLSGGRMLFNLTFFNSSADYFITEYLRATYHDMDFIDKLTGITDDPISHGLNLELRGMCERIEPLDPAVGLFAITDKTTPPPTTGGRRRGSTDPKTVTATKETTALRLDNDVYRLVFFGFDLDDIESKQGRATLITRALEWLISKE